MALIHLPHQNSRLQAKIKTNWMKQNKHLEEMCRDQFSFEFQQFSFKKQYYQKDSRPNNLNGNLIELAKMAESQQISHHKTRENSQEYYNLAVTEKQIEKIRLQIKFILESQRIYQEENFQRKTKESFMKKIEQMKRLIEQKQYQEKKLIERNCQQKKEEINEFLNLYYTLINQGKQIDQLRNNVKVLDFQKINQNQKDVFDRQIGQMKKTIEKKTNMENNFNREDYVSTPRRNNAKKANLSNCQNFVEKDKIITLRQQNNGKGMSNYSKIFLKSWKKEESILRFKTHIMKTKNRNIKIGMLDKNSSNPVRNAVWWKGNDGMIFLGDSDFQVEGHGFAEKETVETQVDFLNGRIKWLIGNEEKASLFAPILTDKNRQFVPYWEMMDEGDTIKWEVI